MTSSSSVSLAHLKAIAVTDNISVLNDEEDLRPWGYAPGYYMVRCCDCSYDMNDIKSYAIAAKHSIRCYEHAKIAKRINEEHNKSLHNSLIDSFESFDPPEEIIEELNRRLRALQQREILIIKSVKKVLNSKAQYQPTDPEYMVHKNYLDELENIIKIVALDYTMI